MIKGINRQIIEVVETGNAYYEKAILFVRPQFNNTNSEFLEKEAKELAKNMKAPSSMKKKKPCRYWVLRLGTAATVGGIVMLFITRIFNI